MSNQTEGNYFCVPAREMRLYDMLPIELREVYAAAPFKYAIAPRFRQLTSVPPKVARRAMIEAICADIQEAARKTYGPDHPDAQISRLDRKRRIAA